MNRSLRPYVLERLRLTSPRWVTRDELIPRTRPGWGASYPYFDANYPYGDASRVLLELRDEGTVERRDERPDGRFEYRQLVG